MQPLVLTNEAIVLISSAINPAVFTESFLSRSGFLDGVEEAQALRVPPLTRVTYLGDYVFEATPERVLIERHYLGAGEASGAGESELILDPVFSESISKFTAATTFISIGAAGINFRFVNVASLLPTERSLESMGLKATGLAFQQKLNVYEVNISVTNVQHVETKAMGTQFDVNFHFAAGDPDLGVDTGAILSMRDELLVTAKEVVDAISTVHLISS